MIKHHFQETKVRRPNRPYVNVQHTSSPYTHTHTHTHKYTLITQQAQDCYKDEREVNV